MIINFSILTTVEDCNELLSSLNEERANIERRLANADYALAQATETGINSPQELNAITIQIQAMQNAVAALPPDNPSVVSLSTRIKSLEAQEIRLRARADRFDNVSLIERQMDFSVIEFQLADTTAAIAGVTARLTALEGAQGN